MQCIGTTKAGNQCARKAVGEAVVCSAHVGQLAEQSAETLAEKPAIETVLDQELLDAQAASAAFANKRRKEEVSKGVGVLRRRGTGPGSVKLTESDIPYPADVHGEDFEHYGPSGMGAEIPDGIEIAAYGGDQEFIIKPETVRNLMFSQPGRNLPKKRLYTIKAIHKDGRLVQLPFELQIQNNAGGDPEDAIGLRRYQRKGIRLLINFETLVPVYCASWDCWAQAQQEGNFVGFCTLKHAKHTLPNRYKDAGGIVGSMFGDGATTSRTWEA